VTIEIGALHGFPTAGVFRDLIPFLDRFHPSRLALVSWTCPRAMRSITPSTISRRRSTAFTDVIELKRFAIYTREA